jgi:hypothetical protein
MQKIISILLLFIVTVSMSSIAYAAPAMWGIAINPDTKECAGYWAGDESTRYNLPNGWQDYYPGGNDYSINTPHGKCTGLNESECCEALGLPFVSSNIGKGKDVVLDRNDYENNSFLKDIFTPTGLTVLIVLLCVLFFAIRYFLKRKR